MGSRMDQSTAQGRELWSFGYHPIFPWDSKLLEGSYIFILNSNYPNALPQEMHSNTYSVNRLPEKEGCLLSGKGWEGPLEYLPVALKFAILKAQHRGW